MVSPKVIGGIAAIGVVGFVGLYLYSRGAKPPPPPPPPPGGGGGGGGGGGETILQITPSAITLG
jgi:hypothetical protein